jgi:hypothetical protein
LPRLPHTPGFKWSSCLNLLSIRTTGPHHCTWPPVLILCLFLFNKVIKSFLVLLSTFFLFKKGLLLEQNVVSFSFLLSNSASFSYLPGNKCAWI